MFLPAPFQGLPAASLKHRLMQLPHEQYAAALARPVYADEKDGDQEEAKSDEENVGEDDEEVNVDECDEPQASEDGSDDSEDDEEGKLSIEEKCDEGQSDEQESEVEVGSGKRKSRGGKYVPRKRRRT